MMVSRFIALAYTIVMNVQTEEMTTMVCAAVSAISGMVATVAAIYTVKLSRDSYRIQQEQREAEKPNLDVKVNPTRDGHQQLAQIIAVNKSRRPCHIRAWYWSSSKTGQGGMSAQAVTSYLNTSNHTFSPALPRILHEKEELDMLVVLDFDWQKMDCIGVMDIENRLWTASPGNMNSFLTTAEQFAPKSNPTST